MIYQREAKPLFDSPFVFTPSKERAEKFKRGALPLS